MATGRGKKEEQRLQQEATTATNAWQPSELEKKLEANTLGFLNDWDSGKDVKDISGLQPYMNLFQNAKKGEAAEKLGGGILNLGNANSGMAEKMRQQVQLRQEESASGQLYDAANAAHAGATGVLAPQLMNLSENRLSGRAQLANQRYSNYLNRPKTPNPFLQLLGTGMQAAATAYAG
ncbi:MAG TPA: hypothetical protein VF692_01245 [Pyrinomonadaceae bacterium]